MENVKSAIKWNAKEHRYEPYTLPDGAECFCDDFERFVKCAQCGEELPFGETYTSLEIHTPTLGMGYGVCHKCYNEEWKRRREAEQ